MKNILILLSLILFLSACKDGENKGVLQADSWPIFRGNPQLTGYTDVPLPDNPALLWTFKSNSSTKSSLIVYNRTAYWSNRRGRIFGVNIEGNQVFDYALETAVDATPMIHDSTLYIGRIDGFLSAISLTNPDTLWNFETLGQIAASPNSINLDGKDAVIIGSYDNYLYGIDRANGREINRFESGYYVNGAAAQSGNFIIFGGCDGWVRIVDCKSGMQTDSMKVDNYIPASPAISGNCCYVTDHSGNLYEIKLDNGKIISHRKIIESEDENSAVVSVPAVSEKMVYSVADKYLYAICRKDGSIAWKYLLKGNTGESSPVVCDEQILVCTKTGIVSIHDAQTGDLQWEYDTGEQILASPAVINGCFYVLTFKGSLFCFGEN